MALLTGEYNHQLDAKNRMRIPAKLRKELGDEFFFAKGTDGCIFVYPREQVEAILDKTKDIPLGDPRQRSARAFLKTILAVKEDDHGRLLLSPEMRAHIGLEKDDKDLIICGAGTRVEIWSTKTYDSYFGDCDTDYDTLVKNLGI
ncbi:MAG: division/cell wall cluster transcriptional repressor MraZ [Roseburia sp.]|nr:division/cell wall cluster transcriptional repressor MraZ [Roseburia sp.]